MHSKCLLIMLDGAGDRAHAVLGKRTPLQKAHTPALDRLARLGSNGLYHPGLCGQCFPCEIAQMRILGYGIDDFPGRGPLEALGADIAFTPDDVIITAHLASAEERDGMVVLIDENPYVNADEARDLFDSIKHFSKKEINVSTRHISGANGIIIVPGGMSAYITDSDPFASEKPLRMIQPFENASVDDRAVETAGIMNSYLKWVYRVLAANPLNAARKKNGLRPLNIMVSSGAGRMKKVSSFRERYGLRSLSISSEMLSRGIASYTGMDHLHCGADEPTEDMEKKLWLAMDKLRDYDFVYVHTGAPESAGRRKDPKQKVTVIEQIDRGIMKALPGVLKRNDLLVVVMADHCTPCAGPLLHSGEPVPVIFNGRGSRKDEVRHYDEISAARGALGLMRGSEIILSIMSGLDRSVFAGPWDHSVNLQYWPAKPSPLRIDQE